MPRRRATCIAATNGAPATKPVTIRVNAGDAGEFVSDVEIGAGIQQGDGWTKWTVQYRLGPPGVCSATTRVRNSLRRPAAARNVRQLWWAVRHRQSVAASAARAVICGQLRSATTSDDVIQDPPTQPTFGNAR